MKISYVTCRIQFLNDVDPFGCTVGLEPTRPPSYVFNTRLPLGNQLPSVHRQLMAPQKVSDRRPATSGRRPATRADSGSVSALGLGDRIGGYEWAGLRDIHTREAGVGDELRSWAFELNRVFTFLTTIIVFSNILFCFR